MTAQTLTAELARELANKIESDQITMLNVTGEYEQEVVVTWTEGFTRHVLGKTFAAKTLRDVANDMERGDTIIALLSIQKPETLDEFLVTYSFAKGILKTDENLTAAAGSGPAPDGERIQSGVRKPPRNRRK